MATRDERQNSSSGTMESLLQWGAEMGISDSLTSPLSSSSCLGHSLFISIFPNAGGRGLAAARDLKRGELILRVPRSALLTSDSVLRDENLAAYVKRYPLLSSTQILTVCLLAEVGKGRKSRWYPYLIHLPRRYDTLGNFSKFEIRALQVEDAIWASEKAVLKYKSDWKEATIVMRELKFKPQLLTFRSWLWASATISSRTLHISWDNAGCLCPVGDLFNYAAPDEEVDFEDLGSTTRNLEISDELSLKCKCMTQQLDADQLENCSWRLTDGGYEEDTNSYCFYARQNYKKGEQALLGYGTYTNLDLLEHYGFLLDNNPNDKTFIQLDTNMYRFSSWPKESVYIQLDGSPSFALICSLRLWATPPNCRKSVGQQAYSGSLLSSENELVVMKWLVNHCLSVLQKLPTKVEDDEGLLVVIDKLLLDPPSHLQCSKLLPPVGELNSFFDEYGLKNCTTLSAKIRGSLDRWRLAVWWRVCHKKMFLNCILYCNLMIDRISSDLALRKNQE